MLDDLLNQLRKHFELKKNDRSALNPRVFTSFGFIETELGESELKKLNIENDYVNSWKRVMDENEVTIVHQVRSKKSLIIPKSDEIHIHLITRNLTTNEEQSEEYVWDEKSLPLEREELL